MKLLFCKHCHDIKKLQHDWTYCLCKKCSGRYEEDGLHSMVNGPCEVIGFDNSSFVSALDKHDSNASLGTTFRAFIIPNCETVDRVNQ